MPDDPHAEGPPATPSQDGLELPADPWPRWLLLPVLRVRGTSMLPTLRGGDLLLARRARTARPGQVVVVTWRDHRPVAVKRLLRADPGGWWVERDNPAEGTDSWSAGAVPPDGLLAVVLLRLWPRPGRLRRTSHLAPDA